MTSTSEKAPPYLSVVHADDDHDPVLVLTVDARDLIVCRDCPHVHVRVLDVVATTDAIRHFASSLRHWADRLDGVQ
jgi:hypothetical protein